MLRTPAKRPSYLDRSRPWSRQNFVALLSDWMYLLGAADRRLPCSLRSTKQKSTRSEKLYTDSWRGGQNVSSGSPQLDCTRMIMGRRWVDIWVAVIGRR